MTAFSLVVLLWLAIMGSMRPVACPNDRLCVEAPRPIHACFEKGEPCP